MSIVIVEKRRDNIMVDMFGIIVREGRFNKCFKLGGQHNAGYV
jgi:hypothetical protein